MKIEDAHRCLRMLTAAFPTYPVSDETAELYLQMLSNVYDPAVGFAVVADWVEQRLTFPKVAELLDECQNEQKRRLAQTKALQRKSGDLAITRCQRCDGERMLEERREDGTITVQ